MPRAKKITKEVSITSTRFSEINEIIKSISDFKQEIEAFLNKKTSELLEIILGGPIALRASDIHIEPLEKKAKLRIRIDGILHDVLFLPLNNYNALLSRIKLLSGIKLNVTDRPQDGRFSILIGDLTIEVRVSTIPAEHGESLVMRILNPKTLIELDKLGLRKDLLQSFKRHIKEPNGMIIVTGPTGSGKTTTLYAFLRALKTPQKKIITIEDPIEYHLEGISQTQVEPEKGYNFASGLQSIMRQDPDVILVGEIRSLETAQIALQAALTGHLVFTTVHTNDAAGTVTRLQSLGAKVVNIAPALRLAIAQRLVRKVCPKCVEWSPPSKKQFREIKQELKQVPDQVEIPNLTKTTKIPQAKGCKFCNGTGYRGRTGIFEAFEVDRETEQKILERPAISEIRELILTKGMITMKQDGLIKVLNGITTIGEVKRITG